MTSRNRKIIFCTLLCIASSLVLVNSAWARPGGGPMGGPFGGELFKSERLAAELELSATQRSAVDRLMDDARQQARPYVRQMMEQHKVMAALMESENFDEQAIRAQAAQGAAAMSELAVIRARNMHELRKLLTPAQREKMSHMRQHHHASE